jgi:hypothetical protein
MRGTIDSSMLSAGGDLFGVRGDDDHTELFKKLSH